MSDYIPTTEEIRIGYSTATYDDAKAEAEFNAWLTEHDRELSERVWEEGMYAGKADDYFGNPDNPYRKGENV